MNNELAIALPEKLIPVFMGEADVRGAYGGRGSAKTRSFAMMIAVTGMRFGMAGVRGQLLCCRQFMNSLDDSSLEECKRAIQDNPVLMDYYELGEKYIKSRDGNIWFSFAGLDRNISSVKSKGRILICWVDEAASVTDYAFSVLEPTLREEGDGWNAELWVTWNPEREGEPVEKFKNSTDERVKVVELNYTDNPKFPEKLDRQRLRDLETRPKEYAHVWLGHYKKNDDALVFSNWKVEEFETDENATFKFGADWGFAKDPSVLIRCYFKGDRKLYIDHEAYMVGCEINQLPDLFDRVPESNKWFIRADSARPETISYMRNHGYPKINAAKKGKGSIVEGIEFLKGFDIVVHPRCKNMINELATYEYEADKLTGEILPKLKDENNHCLDALRYAVEDYTRTTRRQEIDPSVMITTRYGF